MTAEPMPSYNSIDVKLDGSVGIVTLNRPDQLNAWDWEMAADLSDAYRRLDEDDGIRAIVLTGAGRAFCAGAALLPGAKNFNSGRREEVAKDYPEGFRSADSLRTPVIAAINGAAVGAGITMAMSADIRVAAEDATIGFVFHRRGVIPDGDLLWSLPRQIGYGAAMELLLTGRKINGVEAHRLGLVSRIAPRDKIVQLALSVAHEIAENVAPLPAALTKLAARKLLQEPDRAVARAFQDRLFAWSVRQADAAEGVNAFIERRRPSWRLSANDDFPQELFDVQD
ncbi:enoyl-CoA hydratase/isomerase family protein [Phenylobacterium sp. VNQ135]|uniref:enoyl-CoA hydratase/isomerase family protein n=1 Tax=Phenylobacterium sp. VNQ135 TaxID=3400922 RepID=UPI003C0A4A9D